MASGLTTSDRVQYIADAAGQATAVVVPIDVWNSIRDRIEGPNEWPSPAMRKRILESANSPPETWISWDDALKRLGITQEEIDAAD